MIQRTPSTTLSGVWTTRMHLTKRRPRRPRSGVSKSWASSTSRRCWPLMTEAMLGGLMRFLQYMRRPMRCERPPWRWGKSCMPLLMETLYGRLSSS